MLLSLQIYSVKTRQRKSCCCIKESVLTLSGSGFSIVRQAEGGGGGVEGLRGPDAKNQAQHQPIEMKLGMAH